VALGSKFGNQIVFVGVGPRNVLMWCLRVIENLCYISFLIFFTKRPLRLPMDFILEVLFSVWDLSAV